MIKRSFGRDIVWRAREFQARINICLKTCTFKYFVLFLPTDKYIYYGTDSTKRGRIIQVEGGFARNAQGACQGKQQEFEQLRGECSPRCDI